jgi:hypothetical protein
MDSFTEMLERERKSKVARMREWLEKQLDGEKVSKAIGGTIADFETLEDMLNRLEDGSIETIRADNLSHFTKFGFTVLEGRWSGGTLYKIMA